MRRLLFLFTLLATLALPVTLPQVVSAQFDPLDKTCEGINDPDASVCNTDGSDPITGQDGIIMNVVNLLSYVVGFASVVMIIIGGLKYVTAGGNSESINSAKNTILYALIGVAIFVSSQTIVRFVISRL